MGEASQRAPDGDATVDGSHCEGKSHCSLQLSDVQAFLTRRVHKSLADFDYATAIFLCERLVATIPDRNPTNHQATLLLATCYLRSGKPNRGRAVLKGCTSGPNRYILALCCFETQAFSEAESALLGAGRGKNSDQHVRRDSRFSVCATTSFRCPTALRVITF
jgi:hypothetical protein